jgi:4-hydroxy-2-oxoheptanedioate aldolase
MRTNHVKQRLKAGEPSIGTWLALPSPEAAEYVGTLGLDWLVADSEHSPMDIRTLGLMFGLIASTGTAPMVRIPWNTPENIKRVLDAGAWGIVVPMVNSKEEAEQAVAAAKYPPRGTRSAGGSAHAVRFQTTGKEYYQRAHDEILVVLQIEHIKGVENADEILSVPGVDACFIGPNDMAASMGIGVGVPLESDNPQVVEAIKHVRETCVKHGVAPGIHTTGAAGANQRIAEGFQFLALASELSYMLQGLKGAMEDVHWQPTPRDNQLAGAGAGAVRY